jgi:hypothetical protein
MPLLTRVFGYFPGKRLGWLEDTPAGVVHDWSTPTTLRAPPQRAVAQARRSPRSMRRRWPSA